MDVQFHMGKINVSNLQGIDVIVCPTDTICSGSGGLDQAIHQAAGPCLAVALKGRHLSEGEVLITKGYDLGAKLIAHAAVPKYSASAAQADALFRCYKNVLITLGRTDIPNQHPKTAVITLLGTGSGGWSHAQSMDALWRAILAYHHEYPCCGSLDLLSIHYPGDILVSVLDHYTQRTSRAFFSRPKEWGPRVGMGLWYALMDHFDDPEFNGIPLTAFIREIQRFFHQHTGQWLCADTSIHVPEWSQHCSGQIHSGFAVFAVPVLCSNLCRLGFTAYPDMPDFVLPVTLENHQLMLPYGLLSDLADLRKNGRDLTERRRISLDLSKTYFLTTYHYLNAPDLVDHYSLDVEKAADSHYRISGKVALRICQLKGYTTAKALGAALSETLKEHGGPALETLVKKCGAEAFHYD